MSQDNPKITAKDAEKILAAEKALRALQLRRSGHSYDFIAKDLNISIAQATRLVQKELQAVARKRTETAEDMIQLELLRLDEIIRFMWGRAEYKGDPKAVEQMLRAMERKAKLLGLDAPEKKQVMVAVKDMNQAELEAEAKRLGLDLKPVPKGELPGLKSVVLEGEILDG